METAAKNAAAAAMAASESSQISWMEWLFGSNVDYNTSKYVCCLYFLCDEHVFLRFKQHGCPPFPSLAKPLRCLLTQHSSLCDRNSPFTGYFGDVCSRLW